jgi:hypothetical protein
LIIVFAMLFVITASVMGGSITLNIILVLLMKKIKRARAKIQPVSELQSWDYIILSLLFRISNRFRFIQSRKLNNNISLTIFLSHESIIGKFKIVCTIKAFH